MTSTGWPSPRGMRARKGREGSSVASSAQARPSRASSSTDGGANFRSDAGMWHAWSLRRRGSARGGDLMPTARANGIEIAYEVIGRAQDRPLLLVMGLGTQLIFWDDDLCAMLAGRGHRVIRFDNRDVGLSSKLVERGMPNVMAGFAAAARGGAVEAPYRLSDMAADTAGLLDALDIESAHVVGASLGGMIAQTLALEHPGRVRSLTSIMSTPGDRDLPGASPAAAAALLTPAPA